MRDKVKPLIYTALISILLFGNTFQVAGQEIVNITTGVGMPELINLGVRFQLNLLQVGLSVGTIPAGEDEKTISISGDLFYHFGKLSKYSSRPPWFVRFGLNALRAEDENLIDKYFYFNARLGRDLNISKKFGVAMDIGAIFQISNEEIRKKPPSVWEFDFDFPVLPSLGITLFYRI